MRSKEGIVDVLQRPAIMGGVFGAGFIYLFICTLFIVDNH